MNDSYRQFENWWSKDKSQFTEDDELKEFAWVGNDSNLLIVFYVQIMPDDFVMQLHRF
ncbi:putative carnitine operon oxidoreductase [Escherichia coli]|nr:putative carnitine operon oxidoreductase [Escherichia coli]